MTNYTADENILLEEARNEIFRHLIPLIICMSVFGVAGIIGNGLAFFFYAFKTKQATTVVLIACLSVVDFIVCVMFIPNIAEMWVNVTYTQSVMCTIAHFIGLWIVATSALVLWLVSIDRHQKICSPFGRQLTLTKVKYAVTGTIVFGFLVSVRNFANFDTAEVNVTVPGRINITIKGHYCTTRDDPGYTTSVKLFTVIDFLVILMVWFTLVITYTRIIYTLFKLQKTKTRNSGTQKAKGDNLSNAPYTTKLPEIPTVSVPEQHAISGFGEEGSVHLAGTHLNINEQYDNKRCMIDKLRSKLSPDVAIPNSGIFVHQLDLKDKEMSDKKQQNTELSGSVFKSCIRDKKTTGITSEEILSSQAFASLPDSGFLSSESLSKTREHQQVRQKKQCKYTRTVSARERKLTMMMLTVSVLFILCFTPYFIVKIWMREVLNAGQEYELSLLSQIALRLPYMNSVFNPVVYCLFNSQFRFYVKVKLTGLISKWFL